METSLVRDVQMFSTGVLASFALLHLLLYLQQRDIRTNLYLAVTITLAAITTFLDFQTALDPNDADVTVLRFQRLAMVPFVFMIYVVVGKLFRKLDRGVTLLLGAWCALLAVMAFFVPQGVMAVFFASLLVVFVLVGRITLAAVRDGAANARIIAVGLALLLLSFSYDAILELLDLNDAVAISNGYPFGIMGLLVATSVALARDTADVQRRLASEEQSRRATELEKQLAEGELARRQADLDDARRLQASFQPDGPPDVGFLDVAFSQQMALEIGGDYYDYHVLDRERVLLAIGDATGHGTRGGLMVAAAKSLFQTADREAPLSEILARASEVIKQMRLQSMFMGLAVARLEPGSLTVASAGMPPALVRRSRDGSVEALVQKTPPLGAFRDFQYEETTVAVTPGDFVVLLSDGLTECFNAQRELLGTERIVGAMEAFRGETASDLLADLHAVAHGWCGEKPYDDDMTIAVVRYLA